MAQLSPASSDKSYFEYLEMMSLLGSSADFLVERERLSRGERETFSWRERGVFAHCVVLRMTATMTHEQSEVFKHKRESASCLLRIASRSDQCVSCCSNTHGAQ